MANDSALRILISIIFAIVLISSGLTGRPGSIIGAIVDASDMVEGTL